MHKGVSGAPVLVATSSCLIGLKVFSPSKLIVSAILSKQQNAVTNISSRYILLFQKLPQQNPTNWLVVQSYSLEDLLPPQEEEVLTSWLHLIICINILHIWDKTECILSIATNCAESDNKVLVPGCGWDKKASQLPLQQALTCRLKIKLILSKTINSSKDAIILKVGGEAVSNMTLLLFIVKEQPDFL